MLKIADVASDAAARARRLLITVNFCRRAPSYQRRGAIAHSVLYFREMFYAAADPSRGVSVCGPSPPPSGFYLVTSAAPGLIQGLWADCQRRGVGGTAGSGRTTPDLTK